MPSCGMSMPNGPVSSIVSSTSEPVNDGDFRKLMIRLERAHKSEIEQLQYQIRLLRSELKSNGTILVSMPLEHVGEEGRLQPDLQSSGRRPRKPRVPQIQLEPPPCPIQVQASSELDGVGVLVGEVELYSRGESHSVEWSSPPNTELQGDESESRMVMSTQSSSFDDVAVYDEDDAKRRRAAGQSIISKPSGQSSSLSLQSSAATPAYRKFIQSIVNSMKFEAFCIVVILTNCIFLGIVADVRAMHPGNEEPLAFKIVEYCYTVLFTAELFARILGDGPSAYCDFEKMHWYYLDTFVVATSLVEVALEAVQKSSQGMSFSGARIIRVIRLIRVIKVVRIARIVRFVRALRTLVLSIAHTMRSVLWAFTLLVAIIYAFGLIFVQLVTEHVQSTSVDPSNPLMLFWGTLPRSMFTLYMSISQGINWYEVVQPLAEVANSLLVLFVVFISFTVFAVLNVITGVCCEAAIEGARQDNEMMLQQHLAEKEHFTAAIYSLFGVRGQNDDVTLTYAEFVDRLGDPQTKAHLAAIGLDANDAWELFRLLDTDDSAIVDVEEFVVGCLRLKGFAKAIDLAKLDYESKMRAKRSAEMLGSIDRKLSTISMLLPIPSRASSCDNLRGEQISTSPLQRQSLSHTSFCRA